MGTLYFLLMMFGVFTIRVPREGWEPENWTPSAMPRAMITTHNVDVNTAFGTKQFWLLWIVLCTNVTAGIGILEQVSPSSAKSSTFTATPTRDAVLKSGRR